MVSHLAFGFHEGGGRDLESKQTTEKIIISQGTSLKTYSQGVKTTVTPSTTDAIMEPAIQVFSDFQGHPTSGTPVTTSNLDQTCM